MILVLWLIVYILLFIIVLIVKSGNIFDLLYENGYIIDKGNVFRSISNKTIEHILNLYDNAENKNELFITLYILALIDKDNEALIKPRMEGIPHFRDLFKGIGQYEMIYPSIDIIISL